MVLANTIIEGWQKHAVFEKAMAGLAFGHAEVVIALPVLARAAWLAALWQKSDKPMLVIVATQEEANELYDNLLALLPKETLLIFPCLELLPFQVYAQNTEVNVKRVEVLSRFSRKEKVLAVAWTGAAFRKLLPPQAFAAKHVCLAKGHRLDLVDLDRKLVGLGYTREAVAEMPGTYARRGGILDIFAPIYVNPIRVDLFDDEIDELRWFDPQSQLSLGKIDGDIWLSPARELPMTAEEMKVAARSLADELLRVAESLTGRAKRRIVDKYGPQVEMLEEGLWQTGMEQFCGSFCPDAVSLAGYLPEDGILVLDEPDGIKKAFKEAAMEREAYYFDLLTAGEILPSFAANFLDFSAILTDFCAHPMLAFSLLPPGGGWPIKEKHTLVAKRPPSYKGQLELLAKDVDFWQAQGYRVFFAASSQIRAQRMEDLLADLSCHGVTISLGAFTQGFISPDLAVAVISEKEIFGREAKAKTKKPRFTGEKLDSFLELTTGDYVVHVNHGIGRYTGIERIEVGNVAKDYLVIQYAGADKLFVPADQMNLVQKYVGNEGQNPKLYKLGGGEWQRVKSRIRASVQDIAQELLALYVAREQACGHAFAPDTLWQQEFEDAFPFTETPDQKRAMEEIKADMEKSRPMDRLLCGDVGYGKTELALRAAFKAVADGYQVAVLVPTTILAEQHYRTFSQRLEGYPVSLGVISRFSNLAAQKETLRKLAEGKLDILIGTHRLLSKDIRFAKLGLLVVDEEQRFGVTHKEKIKMLKANIDVLTLSATPIPRTLHMALVGMRDMSVINTPPEDRRPVQTYVVEYHPILVVDAIKREIARGGQVYFVHNRVQSIYRVATELQELLPEVKIAVAHGQMQEKQLEQVMIDFVEGNFDVLVCTTIAENGLDIPNVNTLIVDEADNMGLSQLYQLRGRVGRSERQAFAYFTYYKNKLISDMAKKRLVAIRDFTDLGSGFKIALRDMEIRGVGNIMGVEQHGHIAAVGFDMYCRLVAEEVEAQKTLQKGGLVLQKEDEATLINLPVDAYIPDIYVEDADLKIEIYKSIAGVHSLEAIDAMREEMRDRYGTPPQPVENLLAVGRIKYMAQKLMIKTILLKGSYLNIFFGSENRLEGSHLVALASVYGNRLKYVMKKDLEIRLNIKNLTGEMVLQETERLLGNLMFLLFDNNVV